MTSRQRIHLPIWIAAMISIVLFGCGLTGGGPGSTPTGEGSDSELRGGVLATFDVDGERFRVWVTNPATVEQLLALRDGTSSAGIPNGRLLRGAGETNHNAPWSWHLDAEDIEMAEVTMEVCDGRPSYVEENLDEFIESVGRYCPWA
ncbi:MAG TPA: hypothetical protein VFI11_04685, partial [Anaerolineales bacterium]|nr:hypothetical protein [Anaerolineales bacterium]